MGSFSPTVEAVTYLASVGVPGEGDPGAFQHYMRLGAMQLAGNDHGSLPIIQAALDRFRNSGFRFKELVVSLVVEQVSSSVRRDDDGSRH